MIDRRGRALVAGSAVIVLGLAGCTGGGADDDGLEDGAADDGAADGEAADEGFEEGPAPSVVGGGHDGVAVRVDEVTREGEALGLTFVLGTPAELAVRDHEIRILTDTGIELPSAPEQDRTLTAGALATFEVSVDGVTDTLGRVTLDVAGVSVDVPVPEDGATARWRPAPQRQVGLTDGLMRDDGPVVLVPYTVRSEGLITEITFLGISQTNTNPHLCQYKNIHPCTIEDDQGGTYPLVGSGYEFAEWGQTRGTFRFLGELPPDAERFRLTMAGASGFMTTPDPLLEYDFELPSAEDSPLRVAASDTLPDPFDVGETVVGESGLEVELGEMSFAEDRIELQVTATATDGQASLGGGPDTGLLRDTSGFVHRLLGPSEDRPITIPDGQTVEATLVFLTRVAPGTTSLELVFGRNDPEAFGTTIEVPASAAGGGADAGTTDGDEEDGT